MSVTSSYRPARGKFQNLPKGPILHTNRAQKKSGRMCSISLSSSAKDELDIYFLFSLESLIFWATTTATTKLQMETNPRRKVLPIELMRPHKNVINSFDLLDWISFRSDYIVCGYCRCVWFFLVDYWQKGKSNSNGGGGGDGGGTSRINDFHFVSTHRRCPALNGPSHRHNNIRGRAIFRD